VHAGIPERPGSSRNAVSGQGGNPRCGHTIAMIGWSAACDVYISAQ
jgi:hypothetical protein